VLGPADATHTTNPSLTLRWSASTGAVKYEVALDTNNPIQTPPIPLTNVTSWIVNWPHPQLQTPYYWQVRAIDAAGNASAWSPVRTFYIVAGMSSASVKTTPTPTVTATPAQESTATPESTVEPTFQPPTNTPVAPSPTPVQLVTVEAESATVTHTGTWTAQDTSKASGGRYLYSSGQIGDALTLGFSGTHADLVYVKHPSFGSFAIEIDGEVQQTVTANASETEFAAQVTINDLAPGSHTLRVYAVEGTIALDAFSVEAVTAAPATPAPTLTPTPVQESTSTLTPEAVPSSMPTPESTVEPTFAPPTNTPVAPSPTPVQLVTVEAESAAVTHTGAWTAQNTTSASGETYLYSSGQTGDALELGFMGTQATIVYVKHPSFGSFAIEVDGALNQTVVATAAEASFAAQASVDNLTPGSHILRVYAVQGTIGLDAFDVEAAVVLPTTPIPTQTVAPSSTPITSETMQPTVQDTVQATASETQVQPTSTMLPTEAPTATPTQLPPTATMLPTQEPTVAPTSTSLPTETPLPTLTATEVPQITSTASIP
jgi:hypothetical protein